MALQFIIGRAGSGKSHILYENMIAGSMEHAKNNFVAIVPEQYSLETQKEILTMHPQKGSFNIEVTSFIRLAYTVFEEQGVTDYRVMDDLGKTLVMRKVLEDCKKDLIIYKSKTSMPGFAEKVKTVISELKQYNIDEAALEKMTKSSDGRPSLRHKLNDIKVIHHAFNEYIKEKMITAEDVLNIFCRYIPGSAFIRNTYFSIDGFTGFTPVQYAVIELLIKHSAGVSVAITLPDDEKEFTEYSKHELFSLSKETIIKLRELANKNEIKIKETIIAGENESPYRIRNNKGLCFIEKNIFRNKKVIKCAEKSECVKIYANANPHAEAEFVAAKISSLIVEKGYRYNDIAVITGDMGGYYRYLEEEFSRYGIPAFIDHKRNISSNPFVDGIIAAIEIVEKDFSYESVFHMIRLGFMDIERETADIMENYVLQSGRRGYKSYSRKWEKVYRGMKEEELEIINLGRQKVLEAVRPFREQLKKKDNSILDYTKAVYQFMVSQNMQTQIDNYAEMFQEQNCLSEAKEYEQAYSVIVSLLDKVVSLMGEDIISLKEYKQILQAGFEGIKVGIIPPGLDTVMVGDIERTRLKDTKKIIFFIGVNDGIIPAGSVSGGIITDTDREFLENKNYVLAPTARENVFKQRVYLYSLLAKPTEQIYLSYSKSASDGSVRRKSYLISTIQKLFENLAIVDVEEEKVNILDITNQSSALKYIAENIREYRLHKNEEVFEQLCSILLKDSEGKKKINLMADAAFYKSRKETLQKEIARMLYGTKENIGITRLERFAACAYAQFLQNGLKLGERKKFEIAAFDIGNLYHDAINRYFREIQKENLKWENLKEEQSHQVIEKCVDAVMEDYDNDAIHGTSRNLFIKNQVRETAKKTVDILVKHIQSGCFIPTEYELRVTHGRIDRVDTLRNENKLYVKVIDYKSGNKTFRISDAYLGLQMQLMVYLKDAVDYEQKKNPDVEVLPAAGLYFHIYDPYIAKPDFEKIILEYRKKHPDSEFDEDALRLRAIREEQYKAHRMAGMVNDDSDVIQSMDENVYETSGISDILPVQTTKSGLSSRSVVMNSHDYMKFIHYVSDKADDMKNRIMEGNIEINPIEGACQYCPYGGVCRFDRKLGDRYREVEKVSLEEVINILHAEDGKESSGEENHAVDRETIRRN